MRHLWILMLFSLPVGAEEVQVDITGRAFDVQTRTFGTFDIRFDVDTLSGIQSYNVDGPLASYAASSLAITNLSATVNGVNIFSVPSTLASLTKGGSPLTELQLQGPNSLQMDFNVNQQVSVTNRDDPLLGLLTKSFTPYYSNGQLEIGLPGNPNAFSGDEVSVRVSAVGVPEPGILGLLLLGLAGLGLRQRIPALRHRLRPATR
jgi:hypothetical protein